MPDPLANVRVVLGVTGGIAAYKAIDLASKLVQSGADVHVVMTDAALEFVRPLSFEAITHNPVMSSVFEGWIGERSGHVTLAAEADIVVVAPATANTIAKMAGGFAEDMLGAVLLATQAPILVAPAMEHHMWHHPATASNLDVLKERGVQVVEPESGRLASGASGDGRLAAAERIVADIRRVVGSSGPLAGKHVVVTAGGTHEPIDPVRFIGNGSSGTMGAALALAAIDAGAQVTMIVGPSVAAPPVGVNLVRIQTALQMERAVHTAIQHADVLIMAAAVADFRPDHAADQKIKKLAGQDTQRLDLIKNPDIIAGVNRPGLIKVGFAAETENLLANASAKLEAKNLDLIIANDAVATIGSATSRATIIRRGVDIPEQLPEMLKGDLAAAVIERIGVIASGGSLA